MFTIVRKFTLRPSSATEVTRRVHEGLVPLLGDLPGFRAYYLFDGGPDVLVSIRVLDSEDEGRRSDIEALGLRVASVPTLMHDAESGAVVARAALALP